MSDLSAKVFRTFNASTCLQDQLDLKAEEIGKEVKPEAKVKLYNDCNREVAFLCNH